MRIFADGECMDGKRPLVAIMPDDITINPEITTLGNIRPYYISQNQIQLVVLFRCGHICAGGVVYGMTKCCACYNDRLIAKCSVCLLREKNKKDKRMEVKS